MFRIDSEGSTVDNKFTEGDPQLGVPATVVSADWLNATQEELTKIVEYAGIVPDKLDDNQLQQAILEIHKRGGLAAPLVTNILNNSGPLDVTGISYDKTVVKSVKMFFTIERKTDSSNVQESGFIFITYDSADDLWRVSLSSVLDDAGVVFDSVVDAGDVSKLQYTSDDLLGATYSGDLRITSLEEIRL